jgi:hypothetical protein
LHQGHFLGEESVYIDDVLDEHLDSRPFLSSSCYLLYNTKHNPSFLKSQMRFSGINPPIFLFGLLIGASTNIVACGLLKREGGDGLDICFFRA